MSAIRLPAVAGTFYAERPQVLEDNLDAMLGRCTSAGPAPKAIIAPHAGYIYSGAVAAEAYARLASARARISRVVLLGPSHRVGFQGIAASNARFFRTPLGDIPVDQHAITSILGIQGTGFLDEAHTGEHSLEVHLPFLQRVLDSFSLVPLVVGDASKELVARVLSTLWGGEETLVVISSDLSHYHSYAEASSIDARTANKIINLDASLVGDEACGCRGVNGLLHLLKQKNLSITQLDVRNSGDTAGSHDRVVGYGAFLVMQPAADHTRDSKLSLALRQRLLQIAREAVFHRLTRSGDLNINLDHFPAELKVARATFVTLNIEGRLRGCIGSLQAHRELVRDVAGNALSAAFSDPRFKPMTLPEFDCTEVHLSILSPPAVLPITGRADLIANLRPGIDGLIIEEAGRRATYLPSVWNQLKDPELFVSELRAKAGLPREGWGASTRAFVYQTEEFS